MRLTVNLEPDLYAVARALASSEDCSISVAVNRLLRRALTAGAAPAPGRSTHPSARNGLTISRGRIPITHQTVRQIDAEDDSP